MKPVLRENQQGIAMVIAIMVLSLGGSLALIAFRSSTQELEVSRFTEHEMNSHYLAESGVDQVLSWIMAPTSFPDTYGDFARVRNFLGSLPTNSCLNASEDPDLKIEGAYFLGGTEGPFSELAVMGEITAIKFYAPLQANPAVPGDPRLCTLEVTARSGSKAIRKIRVDLASSSIGPITAGIQGLGNTVNPLPVWAHWGGIRYTGDANLGADILRVPEREDILNDGTPYSLDDFTDNSDRVMNILVENNISSPLPVDGGTIFAQRENVRQQQNENVSLNRADPDDPDQVALRRFLRANGEIYTVAEGGKLEQGGYPLGTFDEVFNIPEGQESATRLVWIRLPPVPDDDPPPPLPPLPINGGRYKGYFFFSGDITIQGNVSGRDIRATTPEGEDIDLTGINLEGLFYTSGKMEIQDSFKAYGAFFSRDGFTGAGTQVLEVWYNNAFRSAVFPGIRSVTPLRGTWATLPK